MLPHLPRYRCNAILRADKGKPGKKRRCRRGDEHAGQKCKLHGGFSAGPRTAEGMANTVAAMNTELARWREHTRADRRWLDRQISARTQQGWPKPHARTDRAGCR
jgi:hypothetical protein